MYEYRGAKKITNSSVYLVYGSDGNYFGNEIDQINETKIDVTVNNSNVTVGPPQISHSQLEAVFEAANSCLPRMPGFNVFEDGKTIAVQREQQQRIFDGNKGVKLCLDDNPDHNCSKVDFCFDLSTLNSNYDVPLAYENQLLKLLHKYLQPHGINIPYEEVKYKSSDALRGYRSTINDFIPPNQECLTWDICLNGCFTGPFEKEFARIAVNQDSEIVRLVKLCRLNLAKKDIIIHQ